MIRGIATSTKLPGQITSRLATTTKNYLASILPPSRIQIYSDPAEGNTGSPGYGICLVAETTNGIIYTAEKTAPLNPSEDSTPEDIAIECANKLLYTMAQRGCIDRFAAPMVMVCCAALNGTKGDVGLVHISQDTMIQDKGWPELWRDIKMIWNVQGHFEYLEDGKQVSCRFVGSGWKNVARGIK
jgi:RNA 3'-terminal phosphate cyclase-like protein